MSCYVPQKNRCKAGHPDYHKDHRQFSRHLKDQPRLRSLHIGGLRHIQIIGNQPESGTGTGTDMLSDKRQNHKKDKIIKTDVDFIKD